MVEGASLGEDHRRKTLPTKCSAQINLGLIRDLPNDWGIGQVNVHVVLDDVVDTYACGRYGTSRLRGRGGTRFTGP